MRQLIRRLIEVIFGGRGNETLFYRELVLPPLL